VRTFKKTVCDNFLKIPEFVSECPIPSNMLGKKKICTFINAHVVAINTSENFLTKEFGVRFVVVFSKD
jgi:hypothetical protein